MRHHQRPGGERHQLPREQEAERIVGHHDEVQTGEERGIERQHALRFVLVPAVAERVEAGAGAAQPDHDQEERGERIEPEMRADPGQAERQGTTAMSRRRARPAPPAATPARCRGCRHRRCRVLTARARRMRRSRRGRAAAATQPRVNRIIRGGRSQWPRATWCGRGLVRRTPRPPCALTAPSVISSMPAACKRADQLHQRVHIAAHHAVARLHPLDGRQRQAGQLGQRPLVDPQQRPGGAHLCRGDHALRR